MADINEMTTEMNTEVEEMNLEQSTMPVEVEATAEPSMVKQIISNGLILGTTALVGSVVLKVGDKVVTKAYGAAKAGFKKLGEKWKAGRAKKAEKKAEKEE